MSVPSGLRRGSENHAVKAHMHYLQFAVELLLVDGDDLVPGMQLYTGKVSVGIFDDPNVTFLRTLDDSNEGTNVPISRSAAHGRANHASCCTTRTTRHVRVHLTEVRTRLDKISFWC